MKKQLRFYLGMILFFLTCQLAFAGSGLFFNVTATGESATIKISLCLNGRGPLSCQNYTVQALDLSILTTIPNHNYPSAGIKIDTPGYTVADIGVQCTPISNGYCIFAVNSVTPKLITLTKTGLTVPGAPRNVQTQIGNGEVTVSWTPPLSNGGSPITGYTVTSSPPGSTPNVCTNISSTSCVFTGLTNGTPYVFTVVATNSQGTGASSSPTPPVSPASPPGAPTGVTAAIGNGQATISWTAPLNNGGSPITGYIVSVASPLSPTPPPPINCSTTHCIFTGLTNGTTYTFTVVAKNIVGSGPDSAPSNPVTPAFPPDAPTGVNATMGNGQVTLSWTAPVFDGGSPITSYTVTPNPSGSPSPDTTCNTGGTATSCTFAGLTNGTPYTFTVVANNAVGSGAASSSSSPVTPATVPNPPTNVNGTRGNAQVILTWTAPVDDGGSPVTSYTVTSNGVPASSGSCTNVGTTGCTFTGLTNGTPYTFTVVATNIVGNSVPSDPSGSLTPATTPGAPTAVNATAGNAQAVLTWTAPASNGGLPIVYTATSTPAVATPAACNGIGATGCTFTGLSNGTAYTFKVFATNAVGSGPDSAASNSVTPASVPDAPTAVTGMPGNTQATISWAAPLSDGGTPITGYSVTSSPVVSPPAACTGTLNLSCVFTGLTNETNYTFTVTATNSIGAGPGAATGAVTPTPPLYVTSFLPRVDFSTNGGGSWTQRLLPSSNILQSSYFDSNTHTWYGASTLGSILTSTDDGVNWTLHATGFPSQAASIFVSGNTWYALGSNNELRSSTDGGVTWNVLPALPAASSPKSIFISGTTIFLGQRVNGLGSLISYSTDGGATWTSNILSSSAANGVTSLVADGNTLYMSTGSGFVWSSTNKGASWTQLPTAPDSGSTNGVFSSGDRLYAATQAGTLKLSTDVGTSWSQLYGGDSLLSVFVGATALYAGTQANVEYSLNGGTNWTATTASPDGSTVLSVLTNGTTLYAGTANGNVEYSIDNGANWTATTTQPDSSGVNSLFIGGTTIYAGTANGNVEILPAGSVLWSPTSFQPDGSAVNSIFFYQNTWYAGTANGNVEISNDGGSTAWTATAAQPDGSAVNSVYATGTTIYAGTQNGNVEVSTTGGASWTPTTQPGGGAVKSVILSDSKLYVGMADGSVKFSMDGGVTWQATNAKPNGANPVNNVFMSNFIMKG